MSLAIGIVGLPNVGKSTLFNALLKQQAALAANYPFATIEPNIGVVPVPDSRLAKLAEVVHTRVIKPATVEFVDIAGLVKGAAQGEGLGNQFLSHIRETSAVCHVIRAFADPTIIREGSVSPEEDLATIRTELQLADLATLQRQSPPKGSTSPADKERWQTIQLFLDTLNQGRNLTVLIGEQPHPDDHRALLARELNLITAKPELYVLNVSETDLALGLDQLTAQFADQLAVDPANMVVMSNQIESELSSLSEEDQRLYLQDLGLPASGLDRLIAAAYRVLGLQSFLTAGEKEVRAWTIRWGMTAPQAAGVIHTDFTKHFIKANVASYSDFIEFRGWKGLKEAGKMRQEGKDYLMQESDIVEFMIGK